MKQAFPLEADIKLFQLQRTLSLYEPEEAGYIVNNFLMYPEEFARLKLEYLMRAFSSKMQ